MQMIRPFFGHLRRTYNPAARIRCKFTSKSTTVCFKIHRIQVQLEFIYIQIKSSHSRYLYNSIIYFVIGLQCLQNY